MTTIKIKSTDQPRCAVRGLMAPGRMCMAVMVGGEFCSFDKPCEHKVTLETAPTNSIGAVVCVYAVAPDSMAMTLTGFRIEEITSERDKAVIRERMQARWEVILKAAVVQTGAHVSEGGAA